VKIFGQFRDLLRKSAHLHGDVGVSAQQLDEALEHVVGSICDVFAMLCVGQGPKCIPFALPVRSNQYEGRGVCSLKAQHQIQKNEWINIPPGVSVKYDPVEQDPCDQKQRLADQELWRAHGAGDTFGKPAVYAWTERVSGILLVLLVEVEVVVAVRHDT
jgi:hypothetical protein